MSDLRRTAVRPQEDAFPGRSRYRLHVLQRALTRPLVADAGLGLALGLAACGELLSRQVHGPRTVALALVLLLALAVAARRTYTPIAVLAMAAWFALNRLAGVELFGFLASVVAGLLTAYSAGAYLRWQLALPALVILYAALASTALTGGAGNLVWGAILIGGAALAGVGMRDRRHHIAKLAELARELEQERDDHARSAVVAERARIARELHDVVAHAVSVMVVQAGAAAQVMATQPEQGHAALTSIQETGRQALIELRRLLDVLRTDKEGPGLAPQPGLMQIESLVEQVREAGVEVSVSVDGPRNGVPPGLDLAAYRIVQEALTNVIKHAGAAKATVSIRYDRRSIELSVADDGHGDAGAGTDGHGLVGMRERAQLYGGRLDAGPRPGGGFAVRAVLPLVPD